MLIVSDVHGAVEPLRRVAALGAKDRERQVPEHALRAARAIGSLRRLENGDPGALPFFERLGFDVVFDSLREAAIGTRGPALAGAAADPAGQR